MIRHLHPTDSPRMLQFRPSAGWGETCTLVDALRGDQVDSPPPNTPPSPYPPEHGKIAGWKHCAEESTPFYAQDHDQVRRHGKLANFIFEIPSRI